MAFTEDLTIVNGIVKGTIVVNSGTTKLENVTMNQDERCVSVYGGKVIIDKDCSLTTNGEDVTIVVINKDTNEVLPELEVAGKVVNTFDYGDEDGEMAISGNGSSKYGDVKITIENGADVESVHGAGIYFPGGGTFTMTGGKVTGGTALVTKAGNINISGGELIGNAKGDTGYRFSFNGCYTTGDAISVERINYPKSNGIGGPEVNISGTAKLTSENKNGLEVYYGENGVSKTYGMTLDNTDSTLATQKTTLSDYIANHIHVASTVVAAPALRTEFVHE